jgi:hypothetical protein
MSTSSIQPFVDSNRNQGIAVQIKKDKDVLSPDQTAFNKLTKRIENLQKKIITSTQWADKLNHLYNTTVLPKITALGENKIQLAQLLHQKRTLVKFSNAQNEKLDQTIFDLLDDAFSVVEPDEATTALYNSYSDSSYDEELKEQEKKMREGVEAMMKRKFGVDVDMSHLNENNFHEFEQDLFKKVNDAKLKTKERKKTKKQLEKEAIEKQKEELKSKSIRSIYLSLTKILHPDTEQDELLRQEKEEVMKRVTVAYENRNMMELLQIEMQWISKHENTLQKLDDSIIKTYILLLKDQVQELESEHTMIFAHPRYDGIRDMVYLKSDRALQKLKVEERDYIAIVKEISNHIKQLKESDYPVNIIKQCIDSYTLPDYNGLPAFLFQR